MTRKAALFAGSEGGGETWPTATTLVRTAIMNGLDPQPWLRDVLERMVSGAVRPTELATLLPWDLGPGASPAPQPRHRLQPQQRGRHLLRLARVGVWATSTRSSSRNSGQRAGWRAEPARHLGPPPQRAAAWAKAKLSKLFSATWNHWYSSSR